MYKILSTKGDLSLPPGIEMGYSEWKFEVINDLFELAKKKGQL